MLAVYTRILPIKTRQNQNKTNLDGKWQTLLHLFYQHIRILLYQKGTSLATATMSVILQ